MANRSIFSANLFLLVAIVSITLFVVPVVKGQTERDTGNSLETDIEYELDVNHGVHNESDSEIETDHENSVTTEIYETTVFPLTSENSEPELRVLNESVQLKNETTLNETTPSPPPSPRILGTGPMLENEKFVEQKEADLFPQQTINRRNEEKMARLKKLLDALLENYDKRIRPGYFDDGPTKVGVNMLVKNIAAINEVNMEFQVDFYLRQTWRDSRLAFERYKVKNKNNTKTAGANGENFKNNSSILKMNSRENTAGDDVEVLGLSHEFLEKIWVPDTFFRNEKSSFVHSSPVPNRYVRVYPDGQIKTSTRLTVTAQCHFDLKAYPMDVQVCNLNIGSYGYTSKSLEFQWLSSFTDTDAIKIDLTSSFLPQFRVKGHRRSYGQTTTSTGTYSSLSLEFLFVRSLSFYLTRVYAPAILVVTIAYFALWMGREANSLLSRARPGLGITSVLTITTIYLSNNSNSAHISYLKALDIYLGLCFVAVFATLLQTCFVVYLSKKLAMWEKRRAKRVRQKSKKAKEVTELTLKNDKATGEVNINMNLAGAPLPNKEVADSVSPKDVEEKEKRLRQQLWPSRIDLVCRVLFPCIFMVLNIIYWTHFLEYGPAKEAVGEPWIIAEECERK